MKPNFIWKEEEEASLERERIDQLKQMEHGHALMKLWN